MPDSRSSTFFVQGKPGLSAYQVALANGFQGTEQAWLDSLTGSTGHRGLGLVNRGAWQSGQTYNPNEYVFDTSSSGSTTSAWLLTALSAVTSIAHPKDDTGNWLEMLPGDVLSMPFVPTSRLISTTGSLTGGGDLTANRTLQLVNDNVTPGNSKYYGTNNVGTKGFFDVSTATGTVTSVALTAPAFLSVAGSPITTAGTLALTLVNQSANTVFSNNTGSSAAPAFVTNPGFTKIANLTTNGFVKTGSGDGTLSIDTSTYLTANQTITLSGDVTGSGSTSIATTLGNIPSGTPAAGSILFTNISAPATPSSNHVKVYADSTSKNMACKNDAGTVNHGIQTRTATASNWIRAIADDGTTTISQPDFSDLTGSVNLSGSQASGTLAAARFPALTGEVTTSAGSLSTTVGAMTHNFDAGTHKVINVVDPTSAQDAATKNYVDAVAQGLSVKQSVQAATTATLPANTYNNGTSGVGATLTASSTGTLTVDGYTVALNDRVIVKNEAAGANNGIYLCTTAGAVGVAYVLTRATDSDTSAKLVGAFAFVENGTVNADSGFVNTNASTITFGTTAITFTQFSGAGEITAGTGLSKSGNTLSIDTSVTVDKTTAQTLTNKTLTSPSITTPTGIVKGDVGLGSVTNDAQTKASIVPNTAPSAGQILAGNAGGTAYAPVTLSGSGATATLSSAGVLTLSAIANATLSNSSITIAGTSTALGGSITQDTITGLSSTGIVKRTGANALAIATSDTDYAAAVSTQDVGDTDATISAGVNVVRLTTALTAARVLTLPAASGYNAQKRIDIINPKGVATSSNTVSVARAGSDTIDGGTGNVVVINATYGYTSLWSDGSSKWSTSNHIDGANIDTGTISSARIPTLNQNTTGSAASLSISGQTGLLTFTGLTSTNRAKTVRDAADTILELGGSYTPTGTWTSMTLVTPALGTPASGTLNDSLTYGHDLTAVPNQTGGWNEYFVTSTDYTTTTTTAGTDITGLVSGTLSNSTVYEFQFVLRLLNAANTTGMKIAIHGAGTGTAATVFCTLTNNSTSNTAAASQALNAVDTLSNAALVSFSSGEGIIFGHGFFKSTSTGTATMSLQLASVTASATSTCRVGSVLRLRKAHT